MNIRETATTASRGRTVMLHVHHPTLGDGLLAPVIKDALRAYLVRMDEPGFNPPALESTLLESGAILSVVALPVPLIWPTASLTPTNPPQPIY